MSGVLLPELMRPKTPPQPQMRAKILPWPQIKYQTLERQRLQYLVDYVLNAKRSETEIIGTIGTTNLTWQDFQSLGLQHNLEATIANSCMELICDMARWKKKDVYAADAYVVATWHAPSFQDPFLNLPADAASKDLLIFPVWKPGHWFLCDDMPWLRRWWRHSMLANITLAANANDTALACNVLLAEEPASKIQRMGDIHPEEFLKQSTMTRIDEAECWIRDNMSLFRGHVELPSILSMTGEDRQQFFQNITNDDDIHDSRECLHFVFEYQEDCTVFFLLLFSCVGNL
ncbi:uncharacterized protein LOC118565068 isoform X1 [Fundulus heteroclitus]|uniref:uncharacterized protein LOC118565068 isoform X1 n=1 Tax=Fundulus heteroclitus TaxID=8078 RepID=UPI00165AB60E|nr:uncharacterized protein LOC118565068 isoform X1 [Fundulus heteroclitus]